MLVQEIRLHTSSSIAVFSLLRESIDRTARSEGSPFAWKVRFQICRPACCGCWKRIFVATPPGGVKRSYVEQGFCDGLPLDSIRTSYDYLENLKV